MAPAGYAQYRKVTTQTASPGDLLLQLYQAAIKHAGLGGEAIDRADVAKAHHHITRVQDIVLELQRTLDRERGGEIALQLDRLYSYMLQRLLVANMHKDRAPVDEIGGLLRQLLAAWQVAVREAALQSHKAAEARSLAAPAAATASPVLARHI